jgi:hypothetical protein
MPFKSAKQFVGNSTPKEQQVASKANLIILIRIVIMVLPPLAVANPRLRIDSQDSE